MQSKFLITFTGASEWVSPLPTFQEIAGISEGNIMLIKNSLAGSPLLPKISCRKSSLLVSLKKLPRIIQYKSNRIGLGDLKNCINIVLTRSQLSRKLPNDSINNPIDYLIGFHQKSIIDFPAAQVGNIFL